MSDIIIRRAAIDDAPVIADLTNQLGYESTVEQSEKRLTKVLDSKNHAVFLACLPDTEVVGWIHIFLAFRVESDCFAEIGGLVVSSAYRNRGFGKSLIAAAEGWSKKNRITKLRVRSRSQRSDALAFYEGLGFSKTKRQEVLDKSLD